ncbi:hypothetical protein GAR05_06169 [Micromonospora saelicesensis]|uniref:Uncharacterized protein n=1 Tax=Micromonospora saelicesensis TaxID=285676 RepID=A0ABX9CAF0_9ACTN|nr:hypothetical protein [Micromonospora saelicesensis]RAN92677.1 hypothetical protein GAR05_06169 [Micromonospora saelicesensis]
MNMIPDAALAAQPTTTAFLLQERHTTATGVERRVATEPAGNTRDDAWTVMAERIHNTPAIYDPWSGIRLVLVQGGAS